MGDYYSYSIYVALLVIYSGWVTNCTHGSTTWSCIGYFVKPCYYCYVIYITFSLLILIINYYVTCPRIDYYMSW
ncbi:hypothetical protein V1509DRAFT_142097 [Lipomyces kononenkoae]